MFAICFSTDATADVFGQGICFKQVDIIASSFRVDLSNGAVGDVPGVPSRPQTFHSTKSLGRTKTGTDHDSMRVTAKSSSITLKC